MMTAQMNHFFLTDWTFQKEISEFYDLLSEIDLNIWEEKKKKSFQTQNPGKEDKLICKTIS